MFKKSEQIFHSLSCIFFSENFTTISNLQRDLLEQAFAKNPYPKRSTIHKLAVKLGLDEEEVHRWYSHKKTGVIPEVRQQTSHIGEFVAIHSVLV